MRFLLKMILSQRPVSLLSGWFSKSKSKTPFDWSANQIKSANLKTSFWNEDQITIEKAFEVFEGIDMRLDDTMDGIDLLALYLAIESKFIL